MSVTQYPLSKSTPAHLPPSRLIRTLRESRWRWIRLLVATLALGLTIACGQNAEAAAPSGETIVRWNENSLLS